MRALTSRLAPAAGLVASLFFGIPCSNATVRTVEKINAEPGSLVRVKHQDRTGLDLTIRIPSSSVVVDTDSDGWASLKIASLPSARVPGAPELPVIVTALVVPGDAQVRLSHVASPAEVLGGPPPRPAPAYDPVAGTLRRDADPAIYSRLAAWPERQVSFEELRFRNLRLVRLQVYPARYDPGSESLLLTRSFDIRVDFVGGVEAEKENEAVDLTPVEQHILDDVVLNGRTPGADQVLVTPRRRSTQADQARFVNNPGVKITVATEGLIRITRSDLEAVGFDPGAVDPRNLEMSYRGEAIPCRVTGEGDGRFDPGDAVEFFGVPNTGRYSRQSIYWLEERSAPAPRFATRDATPGGAATAASFPATARFEAGNTIYTFGKPAQEGDPHFFWVFFEDNPNRGVTTYTHSTTLPGLDTSGTSAVFRALFAGRTDPAAEPDHRVQFFVNGTNVGETSWNGKQFHTAEIAFDAGLLVAGPNSFRMDYVSVAVPDIYYLDWLEIDYPRLPQAEAERLIVTGEGISPVRYEITGFAAANAPLVLDVTDPFSPVALDGATVSGSGPFTIAYEEGWPESKRFVVAGDGGRDSPVAIELDTPTNLRDPGNGADLIIVVPEGWEPALQALVAHREAQGRRVVLANLIDVADEFAGGNVDDVAIRDFVAYAYESWQGPPVASLLLVGEPNFDAMNDLQQSPFYHFMPTHFGVTAAQGETMTDTWFGAVVGPDLLPDVAVARFSVRSAQQAADVAAKTVDYESTATAGAGWTSRVIQVASNEQVFETSLEAAAASVPGHFTVDGQYRRSGASTSSIGAAFDSGALLSSLLGHGNLTYWADSPGGPFFDTDDAAALQNPGRIPLLTALNCVNGQIGQPYVIDTLAEVFHNLPTTGALAVWSTTSLGFLGDYDVLQSTLYRTIFEDHVSHVGAAITSALVETFLTSPVGVDLVKEMILLGDPAGWLALDADADGLFDHVEIEAGLLPGDGDSDDDGLVDGLEGPPDGDADTDGSVNARDADADNDGLFDGLEAGITVPGAGTDVSRGHFAADLDPGSTTDPRSPDTDGGGAPDGAEDRDADGSVGATESDPQNPLDDPVCAAGPTPLMAASAGAWLRLSKAGSDVALEWGDATAQDPCVLYEVHVADDLTTQNAAAFRLLAVTGQPGMIHKGALGDGSLHRYLVAGATPLAGEGPWGHFGR